MEWDRHRELGDELRERMLDDRRLLDQLRNEVRSMRGKVRRIQPRSTTAISLVGADGGNNQLRFDPFLVQLVRVVDSSRNQYVLEPVTPTTSVTALSQKQFAKDGTTPATALGRMMAYLGVNHLTKLSSMIRSNEDDRPVSPSWVQVYRELMEWAILFELVRMKNYGSDTLLLFDGLLRSKVFAGELFKKYLAGLREGIEQAARERRRIYLAGLAKHSKVLDRYRLAMVLEGVMQTPFPVFVEVPREMEEKAYVWSEYARGTLDEREGTEASKFVGGRMYFVKFGSRTTDPIWPIDVFESQINEVNSIMGYLLADAEVGFPVPCYPLCLQRAHEYASLTGFDVDVFQDQVFDGLRAALGDDAPALDAFRMRDQDPAQQRYG